MGAEMEKTMRRAPLIVVLLALTTLTGFRVAPKTYSQGYGDGYAVGYNTTCGRGTYLNGDWDSHAYKRGYRNGLRVGVRDCIAGRRSEVTYRRRGPI